MNTSPTFFHILPMRLPQIELNQCGSQQCSAGYSYGPAIRDIYLLHYVVSGRGYYNDGKNNYELREKDLFLISPGVSTFYNASTEDPWNYIWIGFSGDDADKILHEIGLTAKNPVMHNTDCYKYFSEIADYCKSNKESSSYSNSLFVIGELLHLFSHLNSFTTPQAYSISDHIVDFFTNNIGSEISISQLAADYGFSRSHFSVLFKKETGVSPKQYLLNLRIEKARCLLIDTDLDINCIAHSVGYDDPLLFSKQFKQKLGLSPRQLRKKIKSISQTQNEE